MSFQPNSQKLKLVVNAIENQLRKPTTSFMCKIILGKRSNAISFNALSLMGFRLGFGFKAQCERLLIKINMTFINS